MAFSKESLEMNSNLTSAGMAGAQNLMKQFKLPAELGEGALAIVLAGAHKGLNADDVAAMVRRQDELIEQGQINPDFKNDLAQLGNLPPEQLSAFFLAVRQQEIQRAQSGDVSDPASAEAQSRFNDAVFLIQTDPFDDFTFDDWSTPEFNPEDFMGPAYFADPSTDNWAAAGVDPNIPLGAQDDFGPPVWTETDQLANSPAAAEAEKARIAKMEGIAGTIGGPISPSDIDAIAESQGFSPDQFAEIVAKKAAEQNARDPGNPNNIAIKDPDTVPPAYIAYAGLATPKEVSNWQREAANDPEAPNAAPSTAPKPAAPQMAAAQPNMGFGGV